MGKEFIMNAKIEKAFNKQINEELYSAYLYLAMSAHFEAENLKGMANWMRVQAQEEMTHAMKFYQFIFDRDGKVTLTEIKAPKGSWKSPQEAFEGALSHEKKISSLIHGLVDLSLKESDHAANTFLQWFVNEQVEEEASAKEIVDKLKFAGDNKVTLFMMDSELGQRVFTPPAASAE
jgi:ferritin